MSLGARFGVLGGGQDSRPGRSAKGWTAPKFALSEEWSPGGKPRSSVAETLNFPWSRAREPVEPRDTPWPTALAGTRDEGQARCFFFFFALRGSAGWRVILAWCWHLTRSTSLAVGSARHVFVCWWWRWWLLFRATPTPTPTGSLIRLRNCGFGGFGIRTSRAFSGS